MKFDDISWGRYPITDTRLDQSKELELIDEWRIWNSDYRIGLNLFQSTRQDKHEFGTRILIKTSLEMARICKELTKIRRSYYD